MNLVGKIFVFLVFVMSLVFATFSVIVYSTHTNWRDEVLRKEAVGSKAVGWKYQLEDAEKVNDQLKADKADLEDKLAQVLAEQRQTVSKLEAEKERLLAQQTEADSKYQSLVEVHSQKLVALENTAKEIRRAQDVIAGLRQDIKSQQETIDATAAEMIVRTEMIHQLQGEVGRLGDTHQILVAQVAKAKTLIDVISGGQAGLDSDPTTFFKAPPVEGLVLAVRQKDKDTYVELSLGSDDGLKRGHELQVYRGSRYLGDIVVTHTSPDRAAARVDRARRQGPINPKDRFESRRSLQQRI